MANSWRKLLTATIAVAVLLTSLSAAAQSWVPPEDPDPREIRREAEVDVQEGRLDLAAEKYLWYHQHALDHEPALAGVRLSFALHEWRELADIHPRALHDMRLVRDWAEESIRLQTGENSDFRDFVALNDVLKEDGRTIELFKWLDQNNRHMARSVYMSAQDSLVYSGEFDLCERYLVGRNSFDWIHEGFEELLSRLEERDEGSVDERQLDALHMNFARRAAYIVAILVNVDRADDAAMVAEQALEALEGYSYAYQISDALEGIPPKRLR